MTTPSASTAELGVRGEVSRAGSLTATESGFNPPRATLSGDCRFLTVPMEVWNCIDRPKKVSVDWDHESSLLRIRRASPGVGYSPSYSISANPNSKAGSATLYVSTIIASRRSELESKYLGRQIYPAILKASNWEIQVSLATEAIGFSKTPYSKKILWILSSG